MMRKEKEKEMCVPRDAEELGAAVVLATEAREPVRTPAPSHTPTAHHDPRTAYLFLLAEHRPSDVTIFWSYVFACLCSCTFGGWWVRRQWSRRW